MKEWVRRIILGLLALILVISSILIFRGYRVYKEAIRRESIQDVVKPYVQKENYVFYENIDVDFIHAVVAVEDQRYFKRRGFDWIALVRAMLNNALARKNIEGGSTITQQIAKNLYFQNTARGINEKIAEVFLMLDLENTYTKEYLLALYANMNYYGDGYWGIGQASRGYFDKEPSELTIAQAAMLAGIPNAPGIYQLSSGYNRAINRQHKVLQRLMEEGYINVIEYEEAIVEEIPRK